MWDTKWIQQYLRDRLDEGKKEGEDLRKKHKNRIKKLFGRK